jgi:hypothetical protein
LVFLAYFIHDTVADGRWEDGGEIEYWRNGVMVYWVGGVWRGLGSAGQRSIGDGKKRLEL